MASSPVQTVFKSLLLWSWPNVDLTLENWLVKINENL